MASRKKLFAVGAIAASALLVSACSGEPEEAPAEETAVEETTAAPEETQEEQAESNGDVTAPGTTLAIGDTAVVEHPVDGEDGVTEQYVLVTSFSYVLLKLNSKSAYNEGLPYFINESGNIASSLELVTTN